MKNFITILFMFIFSSCFMYSFTGNGAGTIANPYQITTVEQLQEMINDLDAHYKLMNNIDASGTLTWNSGAGFDPIGDFTVIVTDGFTGSLNGQGFIISDLYIDSNSESDVGLFGCIRDGGYVHDVHIENADVTGKDHVGIFAGRISSSYNIGSYVLIENCSSSGSVSNWVGSGTIGYLGGFCGWNHAYDGKTIIRNCFTSANVSANGSNNRRIGGFTGWNSGQNGLAIIEDCFSTGSVTVNGNNCNMIGGFCGFNGAVYGRGSIIKCYSTGDATCTGNDCYYVGGFCGFIQGSSFIDNCFSTGDASGYENIGGFCGADELIPSLANTIINNSYATGYAISYPPGGSNIGGFCGYNKQGTVRFCYSYSRSGVMTQYDGGFIGFDDNGTYECCFWNISGSPTLEDSGNNGDLGNEVTGMAEDKFRNPSYFRCFDFKNIWFTQSMLHPDDDTDLSESPYPLLRNFYPNSMIIPTLTGWAVIIFIGLLASVGGWFVWKRIP